jgi:hypothetical protein
MKLMLMTYILALGRAVKRPWLRCAAIVRQSDDALSQRKHNSKKLSWRSTISAPEKSVLLHCGGKLRHEDKCKQAKKERLARPGSGWFTSRIPPFTAVKK